MSDEQLIDAVLSEDDRKAISYVLRKAQSKLVLPKVKAGMSIEEYKRLETFARAYLAILEKEKK